LLNKILVFITKFIIPQNNYKLISPKPLESRN